jgi:hypothetical protein
VWRLFLNMRLRRETAQSLVKFGSVVETRLPYLDNELVEALLEAPPALKLNETIQTHILRRRRPAFLEVVNVNTGARMTAGSLKRLLGRARQKVLAKLGVKGYLPYERLGLWLRRELKPLVRTVGERHDSGQANHTFLILALLAWPDT